MANYYSTTYDFDLIESFNSKTMNIDPIITSRFLRSRPATALLPGAGLLRLLP